MPSLMYALVLSNMPLYAKIHVMRLELEFTDEPMIYADFLALYVALQQHHIDHICVVGSKENKEWVDLVGSTLRDLGFDMCNRDGFPE